MCHPQTSSNERPKPLALGAATRFALKDPSATCGQCHSPVQGAHGRHRPHGTPRRTHSTAEPAPAWALGRRAWRPHPWAVPSPPSTRKVHCLRVTYRWASFARWMRSKLSESNSTPPEPAIRFHVYNRVQPEVAVLGKQKKDTIATD